MQSRTNEGPALPDGIAFASDALSRSCEANIGGLTWLGSVAARRL